MVKINDGSGDIPVIPPLEATPPPPPVVVGGGDTSGVTTISPSSQTAITPIPDSAIPAPPAPGAAAKIFTGATVADFMRTATTRLYQIASKMLDSWLESVKAQAKKQDDDNARHTLYRDTPSDLARKKNMEDAALAESRHTGSSVQTIAVHASPVLSTSGVSPPSESIVVGMTQYVDRLGQNDPAAIAAFPFMSFALVGMTTPSHSSIEVLGVSSSQAFGQAWDKAASATLPEDMRAELGLIGAYFAANMSKYSLLQTVGSLDATDTKPTINAKSANNFANNMLGFVRGDELIPFINAMLIRRTEAGAEVPSDLRAKDLAPQVKVALLALAMAAMYKVGTGKITDIEAAGLLKGTLPLADESLRSQLLGELGTHLKSITSLSERTNLLNGILAYLDSDPDLSEITNPIDAVAKIFKNYKPNTPLEG